ncbi:MAG: DUF4349 domain-containing protein [Chitinophagaceae bacterium]
MQKIAQTLVAALFILLIANGCHSRENDVKTENIVLNDVNVEKDKAYEEQAPAPPPPKREENIQPPNENVAIAPYLIKNARLAVSVKNLPALKKEVAQLVTKHKAYITLESSNEFPESINANLTIKVAAAKFDAFMLDIDKIEGLWTSKEISSEDVTTQVIDHEVRLKSKKQALQQMEALYKKATKIADVLSIQEQINAVQEAIESTEAQLKYLKNSASFSTVYLEITEPKQASVIAEPYGFGTQLLNAVNSGYRFCVESIVWLVKIWPVLILLIIGYWFWKRKKKTDNKQQN